MHAAGLSILAISVDTPDETAPLAGRLQNGIAFLSDESGALLDTLGILHVKGKTDEGRDIAYPTTLFVNKDGTVAYAYRSSRVDERPQPGEVLATVKKSQ